MKSVRRCLVNVRRGPLMVAAMAFIFLIALSMTGCMISRDSFGGRGPSDQPQTIAQFVPEGESIKEITGQVNAITDGDTIFVVDENQQQHKVRLAGLDAPEGNQELGERSRQNLFNLVYGKTVHVLTDATDENGRLVGKVMLGSCDVNLEQIKSGFARFDQNGSRQTDTDRKTYTDAEVTARNAKLNVWSKPSSEPTTVSKPEDDVAVPAGATIVGNRNSLIYHWAGCSGFSKVAPENRIAFSSWQEAEKAGFRAAKNCSSTKPGTKINEEESPLASAAAPTSKGPAPPTADTDQAAQVAKENKSDQPTSAKPASNGSGYILGPRGGCYHISEGGRKLYVDRSLCQ